MEKDCMVWQTPATRRDYIFRDGLRFVRPYFFEFVSQVDGEVVPVSYIAKSSQKISHFLHRHEPPVLACDVSVLQVEPDVLTVFCSAPKRRFKAYEPAVSKNAKRGKESSNPKR